jgi:hypothetical protein
MKRHYYANTIDKFLNDSSNEILGVLSQNNEFDLEQTQRFAWTQEIDILKTILNRYNGSIFFEYAIPRMGRRIDVVLIINAVIFVLEFNNKSFANIKFDHKLNKYILEIKEFADKATTVKFENEYIAVDQCLELKIPLKYFENFNKIGFMLKVFESDFEIERWPQQDKLYIDFPNKK